MSEFASLLGNTTVAAVSTAPGKAGIAVIRVSGDDCLDIVSRVFIPKSKKPLCEYKGSTAIYGDIYCGNEIVDSGICTIFLAPHSYTGENTAEISCHGNDLLVSMILGCLYENGAVPASPGEFTRRAFMNGKLDLAQAEAVAQLIDAESVGAIKLSNATVGGKLSHEIESISSQLTSTLASIYAFIDYPDEDLADMSPEQMRATLEKCLERLDTLCNSYATGRAVSCGINTAIVGLPNSGKSSLLNLLLGKDRAIVTDIAGTTRDVITEKAHFGNLTLILSDTAGIRETADEIEKIGVDRAYLSLEEAELVLAVTDASTPLSDAERELFEYLKQLCDKKIIAVINKTDLGDGNNEKRDYFDSNAECFCGRVFISAKNNLGTSVLTSLIAELYPSGDELLTSGLIVTGARIYNSICGARQAVCDGLETLASFTPDVAGTDIERAIAFLSQADGRSVTEEIVNDIFSRFCVGK